MFNVIETWGNWDSIKSRVIATFETFDEAKSEVEKRRAAQQYPWSAFSVKPT